MDFGNNEELKKEQRLARSMFERYLSAKKEGNSIYFDADDIDLILLHMPYEEAKIYHKEVLYWGLQVHPESQELRTHLFKYLAEEGKTKRALSTINSIVDIYDYDIGVPYIECLIEIKRYDKVVEYISKFKDRSKLEDVFDCAMHSIVFHRKAEEHQIIDFIQRSISLFPENTTFRGNLVEAYESFEKLDQAIEACKEALKLKDAYSGHWKTLGRLYIKKGNYEEAIKAFDSYEEANKKFDILTSGENDVKIEKAHCMYSFNYFDKAIDLCKDVMLYKTDYYRILASIQIAKCYIKQDKDEKAFEILDNLIKEHGIHSGLSGHINYIEACVKTKRYSEALNTYDKIIGVSPRDLRAIIGFAERFEGSLLLVKLYREKINLKVKQFIDIFLTCIDNIDDAKIKFTYLNKIGQSLFLGRDYDLALICMHKALEISPNAPLLHNNIAMIYLSKNDVENFKKHYQLNHSEESIDYLYGTELKELRERILKEGESSSKALTNGLLWNERSIN